MLAGGRSSDPRAMALSFDVFQVAPKPIPSQVPGYEEAVGTATWPPSTSTYIWNDTGGLLVDALITLEEGERLATWIGDHNAPLTTAYITHPHADHFFGLPPVRAAFPEVRVVALADAIPGIQGQASPAAMEVWGTFFPGQITTEPVLPEALNGDTIAIGDDLARLVPVGATDTDNSSVVNLAELGLVVAGDVAYNRVHQWLAGSTPESRASWMAALDTVETLRSTTLIAGHRHPDAPDDDAQRQIDESREYLAVFEAALGHSATPHDLIAEMSEKYPDHGNPYTLWVGAFDLLGTASA